MKNLNNNYYNPFFSHIYVEKQIRDHPRARRILEQYPNAKIIEISHYKDVFCRSRQSYRMQLHSRNLILAAKEGGLLYEGSPVCQSFGNRYFYYASCMMNCIYDCEYCYLKGMYPSANIVIFVNLEDIFAEIDKMLENHPLYLCISYDTDLLALEQVTGYVKEWNQFAAAYQQTFTIEIRTKCANQMIFERQNPLSNVIYAFTLSPQELISRFEHFTPSLTDRLQCAASAIQNGFPVRLCFDPMIYIKKWQEHYEKMLTQVFSSIPMEKLVDVSVGSFRISQEYLKKMRKQQPCSEIPWFPYEMENGYYHYPTDLMAQMEQCLTDHLKEKLPPEKIFRWT